jgi:hypothetical protein
MFCEEAESVHRLFFQCYLATEVWRLMSEVLQAQIHSDSESVATWWISDNQALV